MGNSLSMQVTAWLMPQHWRQDEPDCMQPYKYDQQFGFETPRERKVNRATEEMMDSGNMREMERNFCAMERLNWRGCLKANYPFGWRCKGLYHEIEMCELEERLHDMKEFEREKRLNRRERILKERAAAES